MLRERLFAVAVGVFFYFLPSAVKDMPTFIAWAGVVGGLLIGILSLVPLKAKFIWTGAFAIAGLLLFLAGGAWAYQRFWEASPIAKPALLARMESDFPGMDAVYGRLPVTLSENATNTVSIRIYGDIRTMTKFVAFYVPNIAVFETCQELAKNLSFILQGPTMGSVNGIPVHGPVILKQQKGDTAYHGSDEERFTGAVYVYYEGYLSDEERVKLRQIFKNQGATLMFRDGTTLDHVSDAQLPQTPAPPSQGEGAFIHVLPGGNVNGSNISNNKVYGFGGQLLRNEGNINDSKINNNELRPLPEQK